MISTFPLILLGMAAPALNDPLPEGVNHRGDTVPAPLQQGLEAVRAWAGFGGVTINEMLAARLDLPSPGGVIVTFVHPEGPAAKAGLVARDMILLANGETIADGEAWAEWLASQAPGTRVELSVRRQEEALSLELLLEKLPESVEVEPAAQ